jgi:hypothetical protein
MPPAKDDSELNSWIAGYNSDNDSNFTPNDDSTSGSTTPPLAPPSPDTITQELTDTARTRLFQDIEANGGWFELESFSLSTCPAFKKLPPSQRKGVSDKLYQIRIKGPKKYLDELDTLGLTGLTTTPRATQKVSQRTVQKTPGSGSGLKRTMPKKLNFYDVRDDDDDDDYDDDRGQVLVDSKGERLFNVVDGKLLSNLYSFDAKISSHSVYCYRFGRMHWSSVHYREYLQSESEWPFRDPEI